MVSIVSEGIHWYNYYTGAGLILKCLSPSPPPPACRAGLLPLEEDTLRETMDTQSLLRRSQNPRFTLRHNPNQMVQTMRDWKEWEGCQRKELRRQFPWQMLAPEMSAYFILELWICLWNLRIESLPTFSLPVVFLCVSCLFSCPLFTQHFPSRTVKNDRQIGGSGEENIIILLPIHWTKAGLSLQIQTLQRRSRLCLCHVCV